MPASERGTGTGHRYKAYEAQTVPTGPTGRRQVERRSQLGEPRPAGDDRATAGITRPAGRGPLPNPRSVSARKLQGHKAAADNGVQPPGGLVAVTVRQHRTLPPTSSTGLDSQLSTFSAELFRRPRGGLSCSVPNSSPGLLATGAAGIRRQWPPCEYGPAALRPYRASDGRHPVAITR